MNFFFQSPGSVTEITEGDATPEQTLRPLKWNAQRFGKCRKGDSDVDVEGLVASCLHFAELLERFGYFSVAMVQEIRSNMDKVEAGIRSCGEAGPSMCQLLASEVRRRIHAPEAQLADPSAAIGLLWTRRGLAFWKRIFELWLDLIRNGTPARDCSLRDLAEAAHLEVLAPFTGWMSRSTFAMVIQAMPAAEAVAEKLSAGPLREDLEAWVAALDPMLAAMEKVQNDLGLEDQRKSF